MTRIYRHTIAGVPGAARPLLEGFVNYAQTPLDLPAESAPAAASVAGSGAAADGRG